MGFANSPTIVTNGLVYCFDPGNRKSYSGSGTGPVINLANVNYGFYSQLQNGVGHTFNGGGYFTFDGVDDYILIAGAPSITYNLTIDTWFYHTNISSPNNHDIIQLMDSQYGGDHFITLFFNGDSDYYKLFAQDISDALSQIEVDVGEEKSGWSNLICSIQFNYPTGFQMTYDSLFNGSFYYVSPQTTSFTSAGFTPDQITFGTAWNGRIGATKIYNRALSRQEMLQNYNAHRGRYGV